MAYETKIQANTYAEVNHLGGKIDDCIRLLHECDYGFYKIKEEDREAIRIVSNMPFISALLNKGVRLIGLTSNEMKIQIYNAKQEQNEIDESLRDFHL